MKFQPVIIARMGSTRLPGKVLEDIHGKTVIERIIERIERVYGLEKPIVAMTDRKYDNPLEKFCRKHDIAFYRGSENDVMSRVIGVGNYIGLEGDDYIIDITADCPLVCPVIIMRLRTECAIMKDVDYASNIAVRSFCDGFDVQFVKKSVLSYVYSITSDYHRSHSTWNVLAYAPSIKIFNLLPNKKEYWMPEVGLTLDTEEDLEVIRDIYGYFKDAEYQFNHYDVYELILNNPGILEKNKNVKRKCPGRDK